MAMTDTTTSSATTLAATSSQAKDTKRGMNNIRTLKSLLALPWKSSKLSSELPLSRY
jgi:hypothetical protein